MSTEKILSHRYAKALFLLAKKQKVSQEVQQDLVALAALSEDDANLSWVLYSPTMSAAKKQSMLSAALDKASAHKVTKQFFAMLAKNKRLALLAGITDSYCRLSALDRGVLPMDIVAASPLKEAQIKAVEKAVGAHLKSDVEAGVHVNPALLGGMVIKVGSKMLDLSVVGKLDRLKHATQAAIASSSL